MLRQFIAVVVLLLAGLTSACRDTTNGAPAATLKQISMSVRSGPRSLNWFTASDATTHLVMLLTQASLVRINAQTQELEPALAEKWERSADGKRYVLTLRSDVAFSDGAPFTADDVVFTIAAAFDKDSTIADILTFDGEKVRAEALGPHSVAIEFPRPSGPGLRPLAGVPILPKHRLSAALASGSFGTAWGVTTSPSELAGLGPFVLKEYAADERLVFERNEHYYRRGPQGERLPRLDRIVLPILPDQNSQILSLQNGESDGSSSEIRPADYSLVKRLADERRVVLQDLGPGRDPDGLWFNLAANAFATDSRRNWIQDERLRQAISLAINRTQFADVVFAGAAAPVNGPVTSANTRWFVDAGAPVFDRALARQRLASIGLVDRDGDGLLDDVGTRHARFTLMMQKGQTALERGADEVRTQLAEIGLTVDVVGLEAGALIRTFLSGTGYDAVYFNLATTDTDPASQMDFWKVGGAAHVWNVSADATALPWEKEIDRLMTQQATTLDDAERVKMFGQVQKVFAEHLPMVHFAVPRVFIATSSRLRSLTPAVSRPQLLWAADTIDVAQ